MASWLDDFLGRNSSSYGQSTNPNQFGSLNAADLVTQNSSPSIGFSSPIGAYGQSQIDPNSFSSQITNQSNILGGLGQGQNWMQDFLGKYGDMAKFGIGAATGIGNIYTSLAGLKLAKDQFKFTKGMAEKNLANQTKAYNSELYNRERSRLGASGYSQEEKDRLINDYIEKNKL